MKKTWITFFSQTGTEIYKVSKALERVPDVIITNKPKDRVDEINPDLFSEYSDKFIWLPDRPTTEDYMSTIPNGSIVTLHGWLRIVPPEVCSSYEIYNSHPAPLTKYPHLKGKDPQIRTFNEGLQYSGNTIHKCIAEVDAGLILATNIIDIQGNSLDDIIKRTHAAATALWVDFLKGQL
jgi:methionyl-tRNA formyltransferase